MTDIETIADVMAEVVRSETAPLLKRLAELEARAAVPGPPGRDGKDGTPVDVEAIVLSETAQLRGWCAAIEARLDARPPDLAPDEIASALTEMLRKELPIEPVRMQKRIFRADGTELGRVVEEPV